jgi:branched-chain amino acid transport system permease protein
MTLTIAIVVGGLLSGTLIAMVAAGFSLVWATIRSTNFAHGDLFALGGYSSISVAAVMLGSGHDPGPWMLAAIIVVGCVVSAGVGAATSVAIERLIFARLRDAWHLAAPLSTLGVSIAIESALSIWVSSDYKIARATLPDNGFTLAGARITYSETVIIIGGFAVMWILHRFLNATRLGLAMRATAYDNPTVGLMGVNVQLLSLTAFAVAGLLAGLAGCVNTLYFGQVTFYSGFTWTIYGFTAAVVGGYGSVKGALIGGIVVGVGQAFIGGVVSSSWQQAITFVLLALVLLVRPTGVIGERLAVRT